MFDEVLNINLQRQASSLEIESAGARRDDVLVDAVLDGEDAAFAELFEKYSLAVTRVVARFFSDRSEIEEMVQQTFTKAYFSLKKYRGGEQNSFPAWLTRIATNVCYDEFRRRGRKPESTFTDMSTDELDYIETVAGGVEIPIERKLVAAQLVKKFLDVLDEKDRIAMMLVYTEDYTLTEVAEMMSISTSNLKSRLFRCRNQIKRRFGDLFG